MFTPPQRVIQAKPQGPLIPSLCFTLLLVGFFLVPLLSEEPVGCFSGDCKNGQGSYRFANGMLYDGSWKDGKFDGKGTLRTKEGLIFKGRFRDGLFDGPGRLRWPNQTVYDGLWKAGKMHGKGRLRWRNGDRFQGSFRENEIDGAGVFHIRRRRARMIGRFQKGRPKGGVRLLWNDGSYWKGVLARGRGLSGRGLMKWKKEGVVCSGQFRNGTLHGRAICRWPGNSSYNGGFVAGIFSGSGTLKTPKFTYKGFWKKGKFHGKGRLRKKTKRGTMEYKGNFVAGKYEGKGLLTYPNGGIYEGEFHEGLPSGQGQFRFKSGAVYTGEFAKGRFDGKGTLVDRNGKVARGIFQKGKLVKKE